MLSLDFIYLSSSLSTTKLKVPYIQRSFTEKGDFVNHYFDPTFAGLCPVCSSGPLSVIPMKTFLQGNGNERAVFIVLEKKLANESLICIAKVKRLTQWNPIPGPSCSRQTREKTLKSRVNKKKKRFLLVKIFESVLLIF